MRDPIITAIATFEEGVAAFNATPSAVTEAMEEQVIEATYGPPLAVLAEWSEPAVTLDGAMAAIRFAAKELREGGTDVARRMLAAALSYFDGGANG